MREKAVFLYIVSVAGVVLSFVLRGDAVLQDSTQLIIAALGAVVLCSIALLFNLINRALIGRAIAVLVFALTFWAVGTASLPILAAAMLLALGTANTKPERIAVWTVAVCFVYSLLLRPGYFIIIIAALVLGFSLYIMKLMDRLAKSEKAAEGTAERAEDMRELLGNQRRMVKSTEFVSRLEERNRLAARIHDEIGHGMSGSLLMLEGADLVMDKDPEKARETIRKVTENLRGSVEKIRKVLRDERTDGADVNLARIEKELTSFEADYPGIKTLLTTEGDMGSVNGQIWTCIYENMTEALTNVLKHSAATQFKVNLKNSGSLVYAEFSDNGGGAETLRAGGEGIGLQNMEERAAVCYGRCFFRHEADGFHIVMTFPRKDSL